MHVTYSRALWHTVFVYEFTASPGIVNQSSLRACLFTRLRHCQLSFQTLAVASLDKTTYHDVPVRECYQVPGQNTNPHVCIPTLFHISAPPIWGSGEWDPTSVAGYLSGESTATHSTKDMHPPRRPADQCRWPSFPFTCWPYHHHMILCFGGFEPARRRRKCSTAAMTATSQKLLLVSRPHLGTGRVVVAVQK